MNKVTMVMFGYFWTTLSIWGVAVGIFGGDNYVKREEVQELFTTYGEGRFALVDLAGTIIITEITSDSTYGNIYPKDLTDYRKLDKIEKDSLNKHKHE